MARPAHLSRSVERVNRSWVRLTLDVDAFDPTPFAGVVERCRREGIEFSTMADLGDVEANHRRLYELNRTCSADIPERGDFYTYDEYRAERIEQPTYNPDSVVIALDGGTWVGMSAASDHREEKTFFNEMTGVLRSHRGRGIALAMKLLLIGRVRDLGAPAMHTFHHPQIVAAITLNRRLGYVDSAELPPPVAPESA
jgi:GNAT superfamily N-acetyltransferase